MIKIGFLGVGAIGSVIATRLATGGGIELVIYDIDAHALRLVDGPATAASSAREVGESCDIVFGCLASATAHRDAILGPSGLINGSRTTLYVNLGTVGPDIVTELGDALRRRNIDTLDAPFTGGVPRAREGTLTAIVSGEERAYARVRHLIERYSNNMVYVGSRLGAAQTMKLVNNAISLANLASACEALIVGAKAGLDPVAMLEVINKGSGQNSATLMKIPRDILTGDFNFGGSLAIVLKDLQAFKDEAERLGVRVPVNDSVRSAYSVVAETISHRADVTEVIRPMEIAAGVVLRKAQSSSDPA